MANSDILIYDSIASSNIPRNQKSAIQSWVEGIGGVAGGYLQRPRGPAGHLAGFVGTLRQYSEGMAVGAVLGAAHAELKNGLDVGGVPVDGVGGAIAGGLALLFSGAEASTDLTNLGSHATSIYSFRMVHKLRAEILRSKGRVPGGTVPGSSTMSGESEEDPIVKAARSIRNNS